MKRIVLTFGLIGAAVTSLMMLLTLPLIDRIGFNIGEIVGYTLIVAAFLPVFFGIRAYREQVNGGLLTFGRGVSVGLLITLITCVGYVATWQVIYFKLAPDFGEKYSASAIERARASGASQASIDETVRQMKAFKEMYDKPLVNAAITFLEPFPVGALITLASAALLRKRDRDRSADARPAPSAMISA